MADEGAPARPLDALRRAEAAVAELVADAGRLGGTRQALEEAASALTELVEVERGLAERLASPVGDPRLAQLADTLAAVTEALGDLRARVDAVAAEGVLVRFEALEAERTRQVEELARSIDALSARVDTEGTEQRAAMDRALARIVPNDEPVRLAAADVDAIAARVVVEGGRAIDATIAIGDAQDAIEARIEAVRAQVTSAQDRLRALVLAEGVAVLVLSALLAVLATR